MSDGDRPGGTGTTPAARPVVLQQRFEWRRCRRCDEDYIPQTWAECPWCAMQETA